jgi:NAD(P)-dependent dehydrogenase (short-subunit alcohol dehydrogenase family)
LVDLEAVFEVANQHVSESRGSSGRVTHRPARRAHRCDTAVTNSSSRRARRSVGVCSEVAITEADLTQTAIVTGGTGGLGAAVVRRLREAGWRVVVPWVAERELERVEPGEGLELVQADLFDEAAVAEVARVAGDSTRAVVNLVGGFAAGGRLHETPVDALEGQLRLNLRAAWLVTGAALPAMLAAGEGSIVCVSSRTALRPFSGGAAYAVAKRAVLGLVDALDVEYAKDGIRTNAILPSVIDTPANRESMPDADPRDWVTPEQIAATIEFLVSPASAATSGAHIPVYGRA